LVVSMNGFLVATVASTSLRQLDALKYPSERNILTVVDLSMQSSSSPSWTRSSTSWKEDF